MADKPVQTRQNHTRLHPPYHFFLVWVALITVILAIVTLIRAPGWASLWGVVLAIAASLAVYLLRAYPLKAQDRIIRLEERLRLALLLPETLRPRIGELTEGQLIALRFASDAELPGLAEKTLAGNLKPAEIKKSITNWRPDHFRI